MAPTKMYVNDVDMAQFEMWVNPPDGWADSIRLEDQTMAIPGLAGAAVISSDTRVTTRTFTVTGQIIAMTPQQAHDLWDAAKKVLLSPTLEVRFENWTDRMAVCRYQSAAISRYPSLEMGFMFHITFLMPSPYLVARQVDVYTIMNGTLVPLNLGTAPSFVDIAMVGINVANPAVTYYDAQGRQKGLLTYNLGGPLNWYDRIQISSQTRVATIHQINDTNIVNATPFLVDPYEYIVADPMDADAFQGPVVGALNCNVILQVRKAYL